jgi:hypothetical protein
MTRFKAFRSTVCAIAALLLLPTAARAASISVSDMTGTTEISWSGFDFFNVNGISYSQSAGSVLVPDAIGGAGFPALVSFAGVWASGMPGFTYLHTVIQFQDSGGSLSDILQVDYGNYGPGTAILSGVFSSVMDGVSPWSADYLASNGLTPTTGLVTQGPGLELVPGYLPTASDLMSFVVNSGTAAPIPEPETYALLLAGLGLLGFHARRRKQKQAAAA